MLGFLMIAFFITSLADPRPAWDYNEDTGESGQVG